MKMWNYYLKYLVVFLSPSLKTANFLPSTAELLLCFCPLALVILDSQDFAMTLKAPVHEIQGIRINMF